MNITIFEVVSIKANNLKEHDTGSSSFYTKQLVIKKQSGAIVYIDLFSKEKENLEIK